MGNSVQLPDLLFVVRVHHSLPSGSERIVIQLDVTCLTLKKALSLLGFADDLTEFTITRYKRIRYHNCDLGILGFNG